ncbi:hypothetical protein [Kiloniella sp.]|uniref:hypothetical protein n=1 Tax=Kiloniella sp. TaxID=1938587 RepID=UPI003B0288A0
MLRLVFAALGLIPLLVLFRHLFTTLEFVQGLAGGAHWIAIIPILGMITVLVLILRVLKYGMRHDHS